MKTIARVDEFDPFADNGRLERIQDLCTINGTPSIAMYLFESATPPADVLTVFATMRGVIPRQPPYPDLLAHPEPRVSD